MNSGSALKAISAMKTADLYDVYDLQTRSYQPDLIEPVSLFEKIISQFDKVSFVMRANDGRLAGYFLAHPADEDRKDLDKGFWEIRGDEEALYLHDMCIDNDFRGKGLAQIFLQEAEKKSRALGFKKIIGVAVQNSGDFWKKQGFNLTTPYAYHGAEGIFMTKNLT